jgi:hypothetical protein
MNCSNTNRIVVITVEGKTRIPWTQARKRRHFREHGKTSTVLSSPEQILFP